jgi:hypothetical protein
MIDYLVGRGHDYHNLLDVYPVILVRHFVKVAHENHRLELAQMVTGLSTAISHNIDLAFNKGKGKVLENFMKQLFGDQFDDGTKSEGGKKEPVVSDAVLDFFSRMAVKR